MAKTKKIPQRMCLGCGEMKSKRDLVRVVRSPDGNVDVDLTGKKSGRGAYICPVPACLEKALKAKRLEKQLETNLPEDVIAKLTSQIKGT